MGFYHPADPPPPELGRRIRARREALGWSRTTFAAKVNRSDAAAKCWEEGTRGPQIAQLQRIAAALGVTVGYLLAEDEQVSA